MDSWEGADLFERRAFALSVELLGPYCSKLIDFIFDRRSPRLCCSVEKLLTEAHVLSRGENILVRLCVDVWCGEAGVTVNDLLALDPANFERALKVISKLHLR